MAPPGTGPRAPATTSHSAAETPYFALMLGYRETRCVPGQPVHARSFRNRNACVIRQFGAGDALVGIFAHHGAPISGQINSRPDGIVPAWALRKSGRCQ